MSRLVRQVGNGRLRRRLLHDTARIAVHAALSRITDGFLVLEDPDGSTTTFGRTSDSFGGTLKVHDMAFYERLALEGEYGLGQTYVEGMWDASDLRSTCLVLVVNQDRLRTIYDRLGILNALGRRRRRWRHRLDDSTSNIRRQIGLAYDVDYTFMRYMLGPTMQYTCAIYPSAESTLDQAQENKLDIVIKKGDVRPEHTVLELGCGYGGLAARIHTRTGAKVRAVTLSRMQYDWATRHHAGVDFEYLDYRNATGKYDRIFAIGISEHVGLRNQRAFFEQVSDCLAPGGRAVIHSMTDLCAFDTVKRDFSYAHEIMRFGELPSPQQFFNAYFRTGLRLVHSELLGLHYARTMAEWGRNVDRFASDHPDDASRTFCRGYRYLWAISGAQMESTTSLVQMVFEKQPYGAPLLHSATDRVR